MEMYAVTFIIVKSKTPNQTTIKQKKKKKISFRKREIANVKGRNEATIEKAEDINSIEIQIGFCPTL